MSDSSPENPFQGVGSPPEGDDPAEQLAYLRGVVNAFRETANPRIKPLRRKLESALENLAKGGERAGDPEGLARRFGGEVQALKLQTYDLLLTVINQVRGTLRIKLKKGMPAADRIDTERLSKGLSLLSQGLRKMLVSAKKGDSSSHDDGHRLVTEAGGYLEDSGKELLDLSSDAVG